MPIFSTLLGISIVVSFEQLLNIPLLIIVMFSGKLIYSSSEQFANAASPISVTLLGIIIFLSALNEEENQVKMLKGFITAVENSNNGYIYDWNKEVEQLKGKKVGLVFGLEEYENNQGEVKTATKLIQFRSLEKLKDIKIPKVKLLDGKRVDYDDYMKFYVNKNETQSTSEIEIDNSKLPF